MLFWRSPIGGVRVDGVTEVARDLGEASLQIGAMALGRAGRLAIFQRPFSMLVLVHPVFWVGK